MEEEKKCSEKDDIKEINLTSNNLNIRTWSLEELFKKLKKDEQEKFKKIIESLNEKNK